MEIYKKIIEENPNLRGPDEIMIIVNGGNLDDYRAQKEYEHIMRLEADKYIDKPPSEWPKINFNWDFTVSSQRHCLDGCSDKEFKKSFPQGLLLGNVKLNELDGHLCQHSLRDFKKGELWSNGDKNKLAKNIIYISKGNPITPPLINFLNFPENSVDYGKLNFQGGNHRFAVAKAIELDEIPIYVNPKDKEKIESILEVRWGNCKSPERPEISEVYEFLENKDALIVHFSGVPKGSGISTRNYPEDLLNVINKGAMSGLSCSVVKPDDKFEGVDRNAYGHIGVVLGFEDKDSLSNALINNESSWQNLETGERDSINSNRDIFIDHLEQSLNVSHGITEWVVKNYKVLGMFAMPPFNISTGNTSINSIINDFPGQKIYTFNNGKLMMIGSNQQLVDINHNEIYKN